MQFRSAGSRLVSGTSPCCSCAAAGTAAPSSPCREGSDAAVVTTPSRERQDGAAVRGAAARVGFERTGRGAAGFPPETATKVVTARASCRRKSCRAGSQPEARLVSNLRRPALPLRLLLPLLLLLLLHVCFCSSFFLVAQSLPLRPTASAAAAAGCRLTHHGEPCVLPFGPASVAAPPTQQVSAATIAARTGRTVPPASPATAAASPAGGAAAFISSVAPPPPASRSAVAPSHTRVSVPPNTAATTSSARPPRAAGRSAAAGGGGASGAPQALPALSAVGARDVDVLQAGPQQQRPTVYAVSARGAPHRISGAAAAESAAPSSTCAAARHPFGGWGLLVGAPGGEFPSSSCSSALGAAAGSGEGPGCAGAAASAGAASPAAGESSAGLNKQLLVSPYVAQMLYEDMLLGRSLEDACFRLYYQGKTAGFVHLYTGQEAVSSGVIKLLRQDDAVVSTYRDHVHACSKGVPAKEIMAELYGKSTGCSKGRGGSMHMFSKKFNLIGGFAFIGEQIPVALGYAFSAAYRRFALTHPQSAAAAAAATDTAAAAPPPATTAAAAAAALPEQRHDQVTVCFLGDGTTNIGQLWEALNIAALAKLPIIFVVENNNWAIGMAAQRSTAIPRVWQRAETFGVAGVEVDGMDVLAVRSVARRAIERARKGEGPTLIEALTYRFRGHSVADPDEMRAAKQKEAWVVRDPILAFEEQLKLFGFANDDTIRQTRQKVEAVIKEAVQFAETSAESPVQECGSYIFAPAYRGGAEAEKLSDQELRAYAEALKEELDWKARRKAGNRSPRPPITQAFKPPTIID